MVELRRNLYLIIVIILLSISVYILQLQIDRGKGFPTYGDVTIQQAYELIKMKPDLVIVDVRSKQEYDSGHIEKAILIPVDEFDRRVAELSKDDDLLIYCRTGNRSSQAVNILKLKGYTRIYHMKDGILGWNQAGFPLYT
ncbi:rhodanese-like domain-containing protein [Candidatus Bathyarchaeota archaeon]|nr:rhodanese-like domain-containing protein [Candidatus Bathyarchaeota archaeon]